MLKVGIIGYGRIGKVHFKNLLNRIQGAKVVAISGPNILFHQNLQEIDALKLSLSSDELINDPEVEAVIICSPTPSHHQYILKSLHANKHVFCEKPVDLNLEKIEEVESLLKTKNLRFQTGFNRRFDPSFKKVRAQLVDGRIGDPHILKITSRDPSPPPVEYIKSSGGMFMDMTIHDFDMARFIVGSEVKEVFAYGAALVDPIFEDEGDIDTAVITLRFENGCLAVIDNSRSAAYGYDQRLELFGSSGMSKVSNNFLDSEILYSESGLQSGKPMNFFMDRYEQSFFDEMNSFISSVREDRPTEVTINDALKATQIALAANLSLKENRPVHLNEIK